MQKVCSIGYNWGKGGAVLEGRFLTVQEIARELQVKVETVQEWCRSKKLPAYKIGREYRIERREYEAFLAKRRTTNDLLDSGK